MSISTIKTLGLSTLLVGMLASAGNTASAQTDEVIASGYGTGYFQSIFTSWDYYYERIAVPYTMYSDSTIVLNGFVHGKDLTVKMTGERDKYDDLLIEIEDCEGVGYNGMYAYWDYPNRPFPVYFFEEPVVYGWEQMQFIFMDDTSHYNPYRNALVLDYQSPVDDDEYLFIAYFDEEWDGELPESIDRVRDEAAHAHYDLMGRKVNPQSRGLHISNGKVSLH